jgi:MFS family permease
MLNLTLVVAGLEELVVGELGGTLADAALFFTVEMAAYLLSGPLWGLWSDRSGRRRRFVAAGFALSGALYLSFLAVDSVALLLALRFLQGAAAIAGWSTALALLFDGAGEAERARRAGLAGAAMLLGVGSGAPLGGALTHALGARAPLAAAGGLFLLLAAASLALRDPARTSARPTLRAIAAALAAAPRLALPAALYAVERFTVGLFVVLFPVFLDAELGADPAARGRYLALFLFPFALGQLATYRLTRRFGPLRPLALGAFGYGAAFAALGELPAAWLAPWMVLLGALAAVVFPPTLALTAAWAPPAAKASAFAAFNLAGSLGFALGPVAGAAIAGRAGAGAAFAAAGAVALAGALGAALALRFAGAQRTAADQA